MGYAAGGAAAGAAAAAAIANANKAAGSIIKMAPNEFMKILNKTERPLVVTATGGFLSKKYKYLTSYQAMYFYTESKNQLSMPSKAEFVHAESIWIPG